MSGHTTQFCMRVGKHWMGVGSLEQARRVHAELVGAGREVGPIHRTWDNGSGHWAVGAQVPEGATK